MSQDSHPLIFGESGQSTITFVALIKLGNPHPNGFPLWKDDVPQLFRSGRLLLPLFVVCLGGLFEILKLTVEDQFPARAVNHPVRREQFA